MLSLTSVVLCTTLAPAAEPEHPVIETVRAAVQDPAKPFVLLVQINVKDGAGPKLERAFAKVAKESRKEKGNRAYELSRSAKDHNEYLIYERWDNLAALSAHTKSPHFREAVEAIGELAAGPPEIRVFLAAGE